MGTPLLELVSCQPHADLFVFDVNDNPVSIFNKGDGSPFHGLRRYMANRRTPSSS